MTEFKKISMESGQRGLDIEKEIERKREILASLRQERSVERNFLISKSEQGGSTSFPELGTSEFKAVEEKILSAKTLKELLLIVDNYSAIPLDQDAVDGKTFSLAVNDFVNKGDYTTLKEFLEEFNVEIISGFSTHLETLILESKNNTASKLENSSTGAQEMLHQQNIKGLKQDEVSTNQHKILHTKNSYQQPVAEKGNFITTSNTHTGIISNLKNKKNTIKQWFSNIKERFSSKTKEDFSNLEDDIPKMDTSILDDLDKKITPEIITPTDTKPFVDEYHTEYLKKQKDLEEIKKVQERLESVSAKTKSIRERVLGKIGMNGETLLSLADRGSKFFGENVGWQTKVFASVGLITAGALSASAGPIVLTSIGLASLAMRGISSASTYLVVKGILDRNYTNKEKAGKTVSALEKSLYGVGAVIIAAGAGQAIGYLFEQIASVSGSGIESMKELLKPEDVETQISTPKVLTSNPQILPATPALDILHPIIPKELLHTVSVNENLWSIVKKTLTSIDTDGFSTLSHSAQETKINALIEQIAKDPLHYGITSGNVDLIHPGETINLTKLFVK